MHFEIPFYGHENVRSLHPKTIEITTESHLTTNGDCIVGVRASAGCNDLPEKMKALLQNSKATVRCTIKVMDYSFTITGRGDERLSLTNPHDIVIRKSAFTCPRTLATNCDAASDALPREMIRLLRDPDVQAIFVIDVT
ncbi:MAG TPA: DUF371 domain-containing protein [Candidatus Nitrosotalea sp.]|nr:DUF371 domain-containing protein [Candidatus Nitrosotalea sp.]